MNDAIKLARLAAANLPPRDALEILVSLHHYVCEQTGEEPEDFVREVLQELGPFNDPQQKQELEELLMISRRAGPDEEPPVGEGNNSKKVLNSFVFPHFVEKLTICFMFFARILSLF